MAGSGGPFPLTFNGALRPGLTVRGQTMSDPRVGAGCWGTPGDVLQRLPDGAYFLKIGRGSTDWQIQDGIEDASASTTDQDPHRRFLLDNPDWHYTEMDWSDAQAQPASIVWDVDGVRVELHTAAHEDIRDVIIAHAPYIANVRRIRVQDRGVDVTWMYQKELAAWCVDYQPSNSQTSGLRLGDGFDRVSAQEARAHAESSVRGFLTARRDLLAAKNP